MRLQGAKVEKVEDFKDLVNSPDQQIVLERGEEVFANTAHGLQEVFSVVRDFK